MTLSSRQEFVVNSMIQLFSRAMVGENFVKEKAIDVLKECTIAINLTVGLLSNIQLKLNLSKRLDNLELTIFDIKDKTEISIEVELNLKQSLELKGNYEEALIIYDK